LRGEKTAHEPKKGGPEEDREKSAALVPSLRSANEEGVDWKKGEGALPVFLISGGGGN